MPNLRRSMRFFLTLLLFAFILWQQPLLAATKVVGEVKGSYQGKKKGAAPKVVNEKTVILSPGTVQRVKAGKDQLEIDYDRLHPTGKFPEVKIQGIPFKLAKRGEKLAFTWNKATYELTWKGKGNQVQLRSSNDFAGTPKLSTRDKKAKHALIKSGLVVKTKRKNGTIAKLEVVQVRRAGKKMVKFSTKTFADENSPEYQMENNIMPPETFKQYEKGVNGEILFIFTSNRQGQIFVYYR